jgi:hypothetical protein
MQFQVEEQKEGEVEKRPDFYAFNSWVKCKEL